MAAIAVGTVQLLLRRLMCLLRRLCDRGIERTHSSLDARTPLAASLPEPACEGEASEAHLLSETWLVILGFMAPEELCRYARLSRNIRETAEDDDLWRQLCRAHWAGKQWMPDDLFRNGDYRRAEQHITVAECKSLLQRRGAAVGSRGAVTEKSELLQAVHACNPKLPSVDNAKPLQIRGKWKASYAFAELDSHRDMIAVDEVAHFRWHLIYHGRPSQMGFRHFQRNGVFVSPHFGETTWFLRQGGNEFVMHGVPPLQVKRNPANWGWVIGAGTGTEYHSKEVRE